MTVSEEKWKNTLWSWLCLAVFFNLFARKSSWRSRLTFYGTGLVKTTELLRWNDIVKKCTSLKINKWGKERLICSEKCTGTWRQMSPDVVVDFVIDIILNLPHYLFFWFNFFEIDAQSTYFMVFWQVFQY